MCKAKSIRSLPKRSPGGLCAVRQKRAANQRAFVVQNQIKHKGVRIARSAPVFHEGNNFSFELETRDDFYHLPSLDYFGGRSEVENIKRRVLDEMTERDMRQMADFLENRLIKRFATKADLDKLATQLSVNKIAEDIKDLRELVVHITETMSGADPRP